jgi:hypothetical protein
MDDQQFDKIVEACHLAALKYRNRSKKTYTSVRSHYTSHMESAIRESYDELYVIRKFLLNCDIKKANPKILRIKPDAQYIEIDNLYICPQLFLYTKNKYIPIKGKFKIDSIGKNNILTNFYIGRVLLSGRINPLYLEDLYEVFSEGLHEKLKTFKSITDQEWDCLTLNAKSILNAHKKKNSKRERNNFKKKLTRLLAKNPELIQLKPSELLNIMNSGISNESILMLHKFVQRNKADFNIVKKTDIQAAINSAKVHDIINS